MTALARLDGLINNAELNGKPEVAAALRLVRDDVAALTDQAALVPVVVADVLNARHALRLCRKSLLTFADDFDASAREAIKEADRVLATKIGV